MVADVNYDAARTVANETKASATHLDFRVEVVEVDVTVEKSVRNSMGRAVETFGRIDYCVNCAGVSLLACT
jgi:NAD(P)-dependent dehydrogenase (short-subunit alcohol dehydrogenase family)